MKKRMLLAALLIGACTPVTTPSLRGVFIAEGGPRVLASHSVTMPAADVFAWYEAMMRARVPALREARGNVAVYVLRRDKGNEATLTVITEWQSHEDLQDCRQSGACSMFAGEERILFEALR
jgi:hypothetical protein